MKFWRKLLSFWRCWKTQFFWVGHFEFFFASFPWKQVKVYWLARMGQNFDQAKRDDTFWPMQNILTGTVHNSNFLQKGKKSKYEVLEGLEYAVLDSSIKHFFQFDMGKIVHFFLVAIDLKPKSSSIWMFLLIHDFFFRFFSVFQDLPISQDHYLKNVANHRSFARQMELRDYFRSPKRGELFHDIGFTKFLTFTKSQIFVFFRVFLHRYL